MLYWEKITAESSFDHVSTRNNIVQKYLLLKSTYCLHISELGADLSLDRYYLGICILQKFILYFISLLFAISQQGM